MDVPFFTCRTKALGRKWSPVPLLCSLLAGQRPPRMAAWLRPDAGHRRRPRVGDQGKGRQVIALQAESDVGSSVGLSSGDDPWKVLDFPFKQWQAYIEINCRRRREMAMTGRYPPSGGWVRLIPEKIVRQPTPKKESRPAEQSASPKK